MEKEFVPYDLALRFKALGFDKPCLAVFELIVDGDIIPKFRYNWDSEGKWFDHNKIKDEYDDHDWYWSAPTFSQAFRWFRDKGYDVSFRKYDYGDESVFTGYYYTIYIGNETIDLHGADKRSKTYEGCELACLDKLIEIVEQKEK